MGLSLTQKIKQLFGIKQFTPDGDEISVRRERLPNSFMRKEVYVEKTGERVYEATLNNRGKPVLEWFGPNYSEYALFNF